MLKKIFDHVNKLCVLSYIVGVVWFILLSHDELSARCYFSENALLPGLVHSQYASSEGEIKTINLQIARKHGQIRETVGDLLHHIGLEVYEQKFSFRDEFIKHSDAKNGTNMYGIVRASRAASTECIVINIPLYKDHYNYAIGIVAALSKQMKGELFWAKDIVYLFTEHDSYGARAWLDSYHGMTSPHMLANQLSARAGSIQSAIVLELEENAASYINLKLEGYNGQLPNMDLSNLAVRLLKLEQVPVAINHQFHPRQSSTLAGFENYFTSTVEMMKQLITGTSSGNHGEFLRHNIEALTLQGILVPQWPNVGMLRLERVLEGICRSLNNLLERFHQSFFFYLLPSTDRYISIGMYMPCLGLILLPSVLKALSLIAIKSSEDLITVQEKSESEKEDDAVGIDKILKEIGSECTDESEVDRPSQSPWQQVLMLILASHTAGLLLYYSPRFTPVWAQMFQVSPSISYVLLLSFACFMGISMISYISISDESAKFLQLVSFIQQAITLGAISIINFSLGIFIAAILVPVTFFIQPITGRLRYFYKVLLFLASPIVVSAIVFDIETFVEIFNQHETSQSWLFFFATVFFYPLWLQTWGITCAA